MCMLSRFSHVPLCDSMDCSLPGSSVHRDSPGKNTGVGCHALLQRIFPTQGSNPCLLWFLHFRWILYCWATGEDTDWMYPSKIHVETLPSHLVMVFEGGAPMMRLMPLKTSGENLLPSLFFSTWDYSESSESALWHRPSQDPKPADNLLTDFLLPGSWEVISVVYNPPVDQFNSVAQSYPTLCDPMDCSTPGLPVYHQLPELAQTHVHRVGDAIQPSHPLSSPSPPAFNLFQHQGLFQWVSSSHQVAKLLEFQL